MVISTYSLLQGYQDLLTEKIKMWKAGTEEKGLRVNKGERG